LSFAAGNSSARYVQIAADSVTTVSPWRIAGTFPIGLIARYAGSRFSPLLRLKRWMS
jgi:hypothetical protein